nr:MAG TPA: hypothetical protein [Inoviridae sp.]
MEWHSMGVLIVLYYYFLGYYYSNPNFLLCQSLYSYFFLYCF